MAVVAVFEIHMERNAVVIIKPSINLILIKWLNYFHHYRIIIVAIRLPSGTGTDDHEDSKGDSFVQVAIFDSKRNHKATDEHHIGLFHVGSAHFARVHNA